MTVGDFRPVSSFTFFETVSKVPTAFVEDVVKETSNDANFSYTDR